MVPGWEEHTFWSQLLLELDNTAFLPTLLGQACKGEACRAAKLLGVPRFREGWETPLAWGHAAPLEVPNQCGTHYTWVLPPTQSGCDMQPGALGVGVQRALEVAEGGS